MKLSKLIAAVVIPFCIGSGARAGDGSESKPAESTLSRAEVLADLQIWQESGMARLEDAEASLAYTPPHDAALARYQAMRASPTFAALVQTIAQRRGEKVIVAVQR